MSAKIIGIIIGTVVVVGGGYYLYSQSQGQLGGEAMTEETGGRFSGSVADLMARGGNHKCEVFSGTPASESQGTVYVAGNQFQGDFTTEVQGMTAETHMIQTGGYVYVWSSMLPQGFKSKASATAGAGSGATSGQYMGADQSYSYDCEVWTPSPSAFTIPTDISFMESSY